MAVLRGQPEAANRRAELAAPTAESKGLDRQVTDLRAQVDEQRRRWNLERVDHRADLAAERDRCQALTAELVALRQAQGGSWWRKLLGGPVATLPEAK